jgi:uncharacterized delta-60 repeat protein
MLALALTAALALSTPGTLDRSFGHDGRVVTPAGGIGAIGGIEALSHGQTLLVGTVDYRKIVLIRYRRNGSIAKRTSVRIEPNVEVADTLLDSRGRLLVAGGVNRATAPGSDALLLRFDRAGRLDPTFDGDGISFVSFGGPEQARARSIALAPDGSIVMAASLDTDTGGSLGLTRLLPDGRVDTSFGQQGFVRRSPSDDTYRVSPDAVTVLRDGRVVVSTSLTDRLKYNSSSFLLRLLGNGSPDPAFPGPWQAVAGIDSIGAMATSRSTGRLFLLGASGFVDEEKPTLTALNSDAKTPAWSSSWTFRKGVSPYLSAVTLDRKGRALVTGTVQWERSGSVPLGDTHERADQFVARFTAKGKLGRCFGKRGIARVSFPGPPAIARGTLSIAAAVTSGPRDTIVIAGTHGYPDQKVPHRFELARLHGGNCPR